MTDWFHFRAGTGLKFLGIESSQVLAIKLEPTLGSLQLTAEPQLMARA